LNNKYDIEEVVNDLFIHLWTNRHIIKVNKSIRSYMLSSVHNRCIDFIRTNRPDIRLDETFSILLDPDLGHLETEEISKIVDGAVKDLSEKSREVFLKSRKEGLSDKSIAREMKIALKTVEAHKTKALKAIESALGRFYPIKIRK
jgi:RNA polymerase sigma-70 factor (ECF subfamily)